MNNKPEISDFWLTYFRMNLLQKKEIFRRIQHELLV